MDPLGLEQKAIPWELRKEIGFFNALWQTIKLVLLRPGEFFGRLETKKSKYSSALFYYIVYSAVFAVSLIVSLVTKRIDLAALRLSGLAYLLLIPFFIALSLYAGAAMLHLFVLLLKGKGGFRATLDVYAYNAATGIFSVIPFVGSAVSVVWAVVVGVIGFKAAHRFSTAKAVLAYAVCPLLLLACVVGATVPFMARGRLKALALNESRAAQAAKNISVTVETYKTSHGRYPADKYDIKYTQASSSLLDKILSGEAVAGYRYSLSLRDDGYEIIASPEACGVSGNKIFKINTGGSVWEEKCKAQ